MNRNRSFAWLILAAVCSAVLFSGCARVRVSAPILLDKKNIDVYKSESIKAIKEVAKELLKVKTNAVRSRSRTSSLDLAGAISAIPGQTAQIPENEAKKDLAGLNELAKGLTAAELAKSISGAVNVATYDELQHVLMNQESTRNALSGLIGEADTRTKGRKIVLLKFFLSPEPDWLTKEGVQARVELEFDSPSITWPEKLHILDVSPKSFTKNDLESTTEGDSLAAALLIGGQTPEGITGQFRPSYAQLQTEQNLFIQRYPIITGAVDGTSKAIFTLNPTFRVRRSPWWMRLFKQFRITTAISSETRPVTVRLSMPSGVEGIRVTPKVSWHAVDTPFLPTGFNLIPSPFPSVIWLVDFVARHRSHKGPTDLRFGTPDPPCLEAVICWDCEDTKKDAPSNGDSPEAAKKNVRANGNSQKDTKKEVQAKRIVKLNGEKENKLVIKGKNLSDGDLIATFDGVQVPIEILSPSYAVVKIPKGAISNPKKPVKHKLLIVVKNPPASPDENCRTSLRVYVKYTNAKKKKKTGPDLVFSPTCVSAGTIVTITRTSSKFDLSKLKKAEFGGKKVTIGEKSKAKAKIVLPNKLDQGDLPNQTVGIELWFEPEKKKDGAVGDKKAAKEQKFLGNLTLNCQSHSKHAGHPRVAHKAPHKPRTEKK